MGDKPKCGAKKHQGEGTCQRPAGWGTDHVGYGPCKLHSGATPNAAKAAQKAAAADVVALLGVEVDTTPMDALVGELCRAASTVGALDQVVARFEEDDIVQVTEWGQSLNVWMTLRQNERDRLARVSKLCLDAGIEERQVRIAEDLAGRFSRVLDSVLVDLGHDLADSNVRDTVTRHLRAVTE